ncbi:MAG: flagellar export protein FliJ [Oscillospiraceae bacterium]|nr:flagellar export protein FliJ [Oscillospiraceae bacterium]
MKKFSFSLQKLLDFKEQMLESERNILTEMNAVLSTLQSELSGLYAEHESKTLDLRERTAYGITPPELAAHKNYLLSVDQAIRDKLRQIELQQEAIDRQTTKVMEAKREVSTIEKLREKKLEEYNYKDMKEQELFIEEFVTTSKAMAAI